MKKLFVIMEKWMLYFLLFAATIFFILTIVERMQARLAENYFEAAIQAVTLDPKGESFNLYLHFFINLSLAWALVKILMASVGLKLDNFIAQNFMKNHVVIISKPSKELDAHASGIHNMLPLAIDIAGATAAFSKVVLVVREIDDYQRNMLWDNGIRVVTHSGNFVEMLAASGVSKADRLIALCDDPLDNITICRAALSPSIRNKSLQVSCLIDPLMKKHLFKPEEYFEKDSLERLRVFNEAELIARKLFLEFPPDAAVAETSERVHIVLLGLTNLSEALIHQTAKLGHYKSGIKPKITLIDSNVETKLSNSSIAITSFIDWLEIVPMDADLEFIQAKKFENLLKADENISVVYICGSEEIINLRLGRLVLTCLENSATSNQLKSLNVVAVDPPGGNVLSDFFLYGKHAGKFHIFSLVGRDGSTKNSILAESLLTDLDDNISRSLHEAYVQKDLQSLKEIPNYKIHPYSVPWDKLPENIRDANRAVADHFEIKARAVGCEIVEKKNKEQAELAPTEIELLAKMEHQRWWADRSLNGWKYAETRDDQKRLHPNMVPYEKLSEADKQKDRDSVLNIIAIMKSKGYIITRRRKKIN